MLSLILAAALVNNVALIQLTGLSALFAHSDRLRQASELAVLTAIVLICASFLNALLYRFILQPLQLEILRLPIFVAVSGATTLALIAPLARMLPLSFRRHQLAWVLVGGNSAVLAVALRQSTSNAQLSDVLATSIGAGIGFALVLLAFAALRERLQLAAVPAVFRGPAIELISLGLATMGLLGLAGLV